MDDAAAAEGVGTDAEEAFREGAHGIADAGCYVAALLAIDGIVLAGLTEIGGCEAVEQLVDDVGLHQSEALFAAPCLEAGHGGAPYGGGRDDVHIPCVGHPAAGGQRVELAAHGDMGYVAVHIQGGAVGLFGGAGVVVDGGIDGPQRGTVVEALQAVAVFELCPAALVGHPQLTVEALQELVGLGKMDGAVAVAGGSHAGGHGVEPVVLGEQGGGERAVVGRQQIVAQRGPQALDGVGAGIIAQLPQLFLDGVVADLLLDHRQGAGQGVDVLVGRMDGDGGRELLHVGLHAVEEQLALARGQEGEGEVGAGEVDIVGEADGGLLLGEVERERGALEIGGSQAPHDAAALLAHHHLDAHHGILAPGAMLDLIAAHAVLIARQAVVGLFKGYAIDAEGERAVVFRLPDHEGGAVAGLQQIVGIGTIEGARQAVVAIDRDEGASGRAIFIAARRGAIAGEQQQQSQQFVHTCLQRYEEGWKRPKVLAGF